MIRIVNENYKRSDDLYFKDIITISSCNSLDELDESDLVLIGKDWLMKKSGGDKLKAIEIIVNCYIDDKPYDDKSEEYYNKSIHFRDSIVSFIKSNFDNYNDEKLNKIYFDSYYDLDTILDMFQDNFDIKLNGTSRFGSWTTLNYVTPDGIDLQIGINSDNNEYDYKVYIQHLETSLRGMRG